MLKQNLVIIGNGIATTKLIGYLEQSEKYHITILSDEDIVHYNRVMLSPLLANETDLASISQNDKEFYLHKNCRVLLKQTVSRICRQTQRVFCQQGAFSYDKLIIATGSSAYIPDITIYDHHHQSLQDTSTIKGIGGFRDIIDVKKMQAFSKKQDAKPCALVVGGGLLGIEAAYGLNQLGVKTHLLHRNKALMNRQIDLQASALLESSLLDIGLNIIKPAQISSITLDEQQQVSSVQLDNGQQIDCQLVIFAAGISPNSQLASDAGLDVNKAICVNPQMQTSDNKIFSFGECSEFDGQTYGLIAPIDEQAKVLAKVLKGQTACYSEKQFSTKLKVNGIDMHSMGETLAHANDEVIEIFDQAKNSPVESAIYKKIIIRDQRIVGAMLFGDINCSGWYFDLLMSEQNIDEIKHALVFGQSFAA